MRSKSFSAFKLQPCMDAPDIQRDFPFGHTSFELFVDLSKLRSLPKSVGQAESGTGALILRAAPALRRGNERDDGQVEVMRPLRSTLYGVEPGNWLECDLAKRLPLRTKLATV